MGRASEYRRRQLAWDCRNVLTAIRKAGLVGAGRAAVAFVESVQAFHARFVLEGGTFLLGSHGHSFFLSDERWAAPSRSSRRQ